MNWISQKVVLFISVIFLLFYELSGQVSEERIPDKPFPQYNLIYDRNVTCGTQKKQGRFPSQTWTCVDIKVDELRMAYGLYEGMDKRCTETKGFDELAELCRMMMKSIEVNKGLWAAVVSSASCDYHKGNRVLLNRTKETYVWHDMPSGYGWVHTIQCMAFYN